MKKTTTAILGFLAAGGLTAIAAEPKADLTELTTDVKVSEVTVFDSTNLIGSEIENAEGEAIADIEKFLIDENGDIRFVILGTGGFLDVGERLIPMPWDSLTFTTRETEEGETINIIMVDATKQMLEEAPEFTDYESLQADESTETVYTYWGVDRTMDKAARSMKHAAEDTTEAFSKAVDKIEERLDENDAPEVEGAE